MQMGAGYGFLFKKSSDRIHQASAVLYQPIIELHGASWSGVGVSGCKAQEVA